MLNYYKRQRERYEKLFTLLNRHITKKGRGLDIGIYPGYFTYSMKQLGYSIEAVDIFPERIEKKLVECLKVTKCDIETQKLPYPDNTFDYVIFTALLEHMRINPLFTLREIRRVLKLNGVLILQTPNMAYWKYRLFMLVGMGQEPSPYFAYNLLEKMGHVGHVTLYTLSQLVEILEKTGFEIEVKGWEHQFVHVRTIKNLVDLVTGIYPPLQQQLLVVAKRKAKK